MRLVGLVLVLLAAAVIGVMWLGANGVARVRVITVRETQGVVRAKVLSGTGYVTARRRATVSTKITGKLVEVQVEEGMPVKEGQVLAKLDDSQLQASLALAESRVAAARRSVEEAHARLELSELTLDRTRKLTGNGLSDKAELDAALADVEALRARLALEKEQVRVAEREVALRRVELADTIIYAPFDGVVISKDAQAGETVSPVSAGGGFTRTGICTIVDMGSLEIEFDVNERYINRVQPGQPVEAVLDAYPEWRIPARVITAVPAADRQKATVLVRIAFDQLDPRILPDMGIQVSFLAAEGPAVRSLRPRILVPRSVLRGGDERSMVYVVKGDRVERRSIRVGAVSGDDVEVISGLTAGEKVVVEGPENLRDGDQVTLR